MVLNSWEGPEAAFGASPQSEMIASWSGPGMVPTEYKGAARVFARNGGIPSVRTDRLNQRAVNVMLRLTAETP